MKPSTKGLLCAWVIASTGVLGTLGLGTSVTSAQTTSREVPLEPEATPPTATPEGASPESASPEGASPEAASPEGANPEGANPEGANPEGANPEGASPEGASPEGASPEGASPEGARPEGASPDAVPAVEVRAADPLETARPPERDGASDTGCPATARAVGPLQVSFLDGQLGVARRACLRDEVSIAEDASLIARPADFYGNIRLGTRISGSVVVRPDLSLWGSLEVFRYQTLLSAVGNTYMGLGYLSLGATYRYYAEHARSLVAYARLVLPTTSGLDRRSQPLALELGTTAEVTASENVRFHAFLSAIGSVGLSDVAPPDPRAGLRVGGGVDWVPYEAFSLVLELSGGFGYRDALDFLAVSAGLRFAFGDLLAADLGVVYPFVGAEPALAAAQLAISGRFDGRRY